MSEFDHSMVRSSAGEDTMVVSEIAARSIGIPEPSARFLVALFSGELLFCVCCLSRSRDQ